MLLSRVLSESRISDISRSINYGDHKFNTAFTFRYFSTFLKLSLIHSPKIMLRRYFGILPIYDGTSVENFTTKKEVERNLMIKRTLFTEINRKRFYTPYISLEEARSSDKYYKGLVRCYKNSDGHIVYYIESGHHRFDIRSVLDLNRALEHNVVYFQIYESERNTGGENPTAKVVHILRRSRIGTFSGFLSSFSGNFYKIYNFYNPWNSALVPKDDKIISQTDVINSHYIGDIESWPETSKFPILKLITKRPGHQPKDIVFSSRLDTGDSEYLCIKKYLNSNAQPTELEIPNDRLNLTSDCTFTFKHRHHLEKNNAVSFKDIDGGGFEIGVHFPDVSHFVLPESETDKLASNLLKSNYTHSRLYNMLPTSLSLDICNLVADRNRYAVSVLMKFDKSCRLSNYWIGRSVIKSAAVLSDLQLKKLMNGNQSNRVTDPEVYNGFSLSDIQIILKKLSHLINNLRDSESNNYKPFFNQANNFKFLLKSLRILPTMYKNSEWNEGYNIYRQLEKLVNILVARKMWEKGLEGSILRVHRIDKVNTQVIGFLKERGFDIDISSFGKLELSLENIKNMYGLDVSCSIFYVLYCNFNNTQYKILRKKEGTQEFDAESYKNFFMGDDFYTHFSAPLVKYIQLLAQRMFIDNEISLPNTKESWDRLENIVQLCNSSDRRNFLRNEHSAYFKLWLQIKREGPLVCKGSLIPNLGVLQKDKFTRLMLHPSHVVIPLGENRAQVGEKEYFKIFNVEIRAKETDTTFDQLEFPFDIKINTQL